MTDPLTRRQAAIVGAFTGVLVGPFGDVHAYVEEVLGRPVLTHELADEVVLEAIWRAVKGDFAALAPVVVDDPHHLTGDTR